MTWLEEVAVRRRANESPVVLIESEDPVRREQLVKALEEGGRRLLGLKDEPTLVQLDLQRMELVAGGAARPSMSPVRELDQMFRGGTGVLAVIYRVDEARHAQLLHDHLVAWSYTDRSRMLARQNTAFVLASSLDLFSSSLRRLCMEVRVPASTPEERRALLESFAREVAARAGVELEVTEELVEASRGLNLSEVWAAASRSFRDHRRLAPEAFAARKREILESMGLSYVEPDRGFEDVGGYGYLKEFIRRRVLRPLKDPEGARRYGVQVPRGVLLVGPPGTGKSLFAEALARELGLAMVRLSAADFFSRYVGETEANVRRVRRVVEELAPVVVFFDEFDQLAAERGRVGVESDSGTTRRFQSGLLEWLGDPRRRSFVVAATNFIGDLDEAFIRPGRMDYVVPVLPPDREARKEIVRVVARRYGVPLAEDLDLDEVARRTYMFTGAMIEKCVREAAAMAWDQDAGAVTTDILLEAVRRHEGEVRETEEHVRRMLDEIKRRARSVDRWLISEAAKCFEEEEEAEIASLLRQL